MKKPFIIFMFALLLYSFPFNVLALSGSSQTIGGVTHYYFNDGTSGSSQTIGGVTHYYIDTPSNQQTTHTGCSDVTLSKCDEIKKEQDYWNNIYMDRVNEYISKMSPEDQASIWASSYSTMQAELQGLNNRSNYLDCSFCWLNVVLKTDCSPYKNTYLKDDKCVCNQGYKVYNNQCVSFSDYCYYKFGEHTFGGEDDISDYCSCVNGYIWNNEMTSCIQKIDNNIINNSEPPIIKNEVQQQPVNQPPAQPTIQPRVQSQFTQPNFPILNSPKEVIPDETHTSSQTDKNNKLTVKNFISHLFSFFVNIVESINFW